MSDRGNKKRMRGGGDVNYLSSSDVQLEYRKSEQVTKKLMRRDRKTKRRGESSESKFKEG